MSNFISFFKKSYPQNIEKSGEMTNKFIHDKLISLLKNNAIDKINHNNLFESQLFEKKISFITSVMMSESLDGIEEKNKQNLFRKLLANNGVIISKLADNYKKSLNIEIYEIRKKILSFIKSKINIGYDYGNEDIFDEHSFYYYIFKWKEFISKFVSEFKIRQRFINKKPYDEILINYQSFNIKSLSELYNFMDEFDNFYHIYMNYENIFYIMKKINLILKEKNMESKELITEEINRIYNDFEESTFNLSSLFNRLNSKIEGVSEKVKIHNKEIEKLKMENKNLIKDNINLKKDIGILKMDNKNLNDRVFVLETNWKELKDNLKCPLTEEILNSPVITPYGFTYERNEIEKWLKKSSTDPISRKSLTEQQLIRNIKLENVIEVFKKTINKIKKK